MKTLWQKTEGKTGAREHSQSDRTWFYRFTAEEDRELDRNLVPYDILVNLAQARMLLRVGVYDQPGYEKVVSALRNAWQEWEDGAFGLGPDDEDVHSAVEKYVTEKAGRDGARIHTGRSRNDQVLADMRLFMKKSIVDIAAEWLSVANRLAGIAESYKGVFFAGMTHTQPAMPHSVDAWAAGYLDLLASDLKALQSAFTLVDRSPLGSAAGYGVPYIRVDREYVAGQLGFASVQEPVAASQLSRGRFEMQVVDALAYGALTFNRMASDVVLFMHPSWSLVTLSEDQVSGSSIMPQKRNPDAWELIRGAYHDFQAARTHLAGIPANLGSGYHRDLQVVKKSVVSAVRQSMMLAEAVRHALSGLEFNRDRARSSLTPDVYATHEANRLVAGGMPFREAYRKVAERHGAESRQSAADPEDAANQQGSAGREGDTGQQDVPGKSDTSQPATFRETLGATEQVGKTVYHHSGAPGSGVPEALLGAVRESEQWTEARKNEWERTKANLLS
ncbi:lyase family protein [Balneolales bacterium ANBcel1]|nr:lyase family protein [Balneolales bacterium ANBcel1]